MAGVGDLCPPAVADGLLSWHGSDCLRHFALDLAGNVSRNDPFSLGRSGGDRPCDGVAPRAHVDCNADPCPPPTDAKRHRASLGDVIARAMGSKRVCNCPVSLFPLGVNAMAIETPSVLWADFGSQLERPRDGILPLSPYVSPSLGLNPMDTADRDSPLHNADVLSEPEQRARGRSPQQPPKLIDIRFGVDLVVTRFYVVLMVGKDRRDRQRSHTVGRLTKLGNTLTAVVFLLGTNLALSGSIVLFLYLVKSMLGISLLPGHFADYLKQLLQ